MSHNLETLPGVRLDTRKHRVLTQERAALCETYLKVADRGTMAAVRKTHLPLGIYPGLEYDDVISVGRIALCEAACDWRWNDGDFGSFAFMRAYFRTVDWVRRVGPLERNRGQTDRKRYSVQTIPWVFEFSRKEERLVMTTESQIRKEDRAMNPSERAERAMWLADMLKHLPPRQQRILFRYFAEGLTLREISLELGVGESRVSQLLTKSLNHLRSLALEGVIDVSPA